MPSVLWLVQALSLAVGCHFGLSAGDSGLSEAGLDSQGGRDTGAGLDSAPDTDTARGGDSGADPDTDAEGDDDLKVLTLNLHCFKLDGTLFGSNDERFAAIASTVASEGVLAIAVQEACENDAEGVAIDRLAAALDVATGASWGTTWTPTHVAWSGTSDEAQEGVGLLVSGAEPADVAILDYSVQGALDRRLVAGTFPTAAGSAVRLVSVHLDYEDPDVRRAQARQSAMHALVNADDSWGVLIAGDFNALADDSAMIDLGYAGLTRASAESDGDGTNIDHVFAPVPANFEVIESRLLFTGTAEPVVSDHPGVLVHLRRGAPTAAVVTRFVANFDVGLGHYLGLRGDTSPLDWDVGWPAANTSSDRWEAAFLGWPSGGVSYKWLYDDSEWETGDDHGLDAGTTGEVAPAF